MAVAILVIWSVEPGDEASEDAIVVLKDPEIEGDLLTYTADESSASAHPARPWAHELSKVGFRA